MEKEEIEKAFEEYQFEYQKRKVDISARLLKIVGNKEIPTLYRDWVREAAQFILEEK